MLTHDPDIELTKKGEAYAASHAEPDVLVVTLEKTDRSSIASIVDALIAALDDLDGDADLECAGDPEPALGWCLTGQNGNNDDREDGEDPGEDDDPAEWAGDEREPSLGAPERHPSTWGNGLLGHSPQWSNPGKNDEREEENEHGGDVLDEPHDGEEWW